MQKLVLCFVALLIPIGVAAQEQIVTPKQRVAIRSSPPSPWLLGFPGPKVAEAEASERYELLRTLKIHAFRSTYMWAEVRLAGGADDAKEGWVYFGQSLGDSVNFTIGEHTANQQEREQHSLGPQQ